MKWDTWRALDEVGIQAFVVKTAELAEVLLIIQQVVKADELTQSRVATTEISSDFRLTERELDVLICAARGWNE
jgi:DNA-binding NarL/FixJ family response regulator